MFRTAHSRQFGFVQISGSCLFFIENLCLRIFVLILAGTATTAAVVVGVSIATAGGL